MFELGRFFTRKEWQTLTFREWIESTPKEARVGKYLVRYIFMPSKYPSGTLLFEVGENTRVKITIPRDKWRALMQTLGFTKRRNYECTIYLVVQHDSYGVEMEEGAGTYEYQSYGWKYTTEENGGIEL